MDYRELLLLWAARESGVLEAATMTAETPAEVAEEAEVTPRAAEITMDALAEVGFLEQVGDGYEITNRALGFVAKADVRSIGSVPHRLDCLDRWLDLPETMRTGDPPETPDEWTTNFMGAMANVDEATVRACVTAAVHRQPDAETVLDAGGGPGVFAKEFVRRGFDVTLVDREQVVELDRRFLEHEPIDLTPGDITADLPDGFDLVFCSRVAHALGPDANRAVLRNAFDALEPGGSVVLVDLLRGESEGAALTAAHMLAQTPDGNTYTRREFSDWLTDAGFTDIEIEPVPGTELYGIAGRRPRD